jgi:hypothetical protein
MERLRRWACVLQRQLQGLSGEAAESEEEEVQHQQAASAAAAAGVQPGSDASAAGVGQQQQQYLGSLAGQLPDDEGAVRASLAGEVPAGEVAGIGVRENTLYGSAMTPPESPYKEQQLAALNQQQEDDAAAANSAAQPDSEAQQQGEEQGEAALADGTSEQQQQQYHGSEASLSLAGSCITAKPSSQFSLGGAGSRPHISYNDSEPMLTPPALQLDPLSAGASAAAVDEVGIAAAAGGAGGITLKANSAAAHGALTSDELQAAAEAAAVAAASLPSSPRAGAAAAAAAAGVSIWEAAGAAAAQLPAGSVAPAQAKLAYKALLDSNSQQQDGATAAAGAEQGGRTYGLAELVGEVSDTLSSARSDAGVASSSQRDLLSSRHVMLQVAEEQQGADDAAASDAERQKQQAAGTGFRSGRSSPLRSPRGMQRSSLPGVFNAFSCGWLEFGSFMCWPSGMNKVQASRSICSKTLALPCCCSRDPLPGCMALYARHAWAVVAMSPQPLAAVLTSSPYRDICCTQAPQKMQQLAAKMALQVRTLPLGRPFLTYVIVVTSAAWMQAPQRKQLAAKTTLQVKVMWSRRAGKATGSGQLAACATALLVVPLQMLQSQLLLQQTASPQEPAAALAPAGAWCQG